LTLQIALVTSLVWGQWPLRGWVVWLGIPRGHFPAYKRAQGARCCPILTTLEDVDIFEKKIPKYKIS
jgi:hypothetical protein